uniref:VP5 n=1 Tax=viral metagenome TaxID=1070528 RepID=A0A2V0RAW6_9ZZZZ
MSATPQIQTEEYIKKLIKIIKNPYENASPGDLPAPGTSTGAAVYSTEGSQSIACDENTTSAIAVYDPEVTLRRGQPAVHIYERNSAHKILKVQSMNVGRPSSDFLAGGVISSSLQSSNTSSVDSIAGSQSAAVLYAVPKSLANLKSTDLSQICLNKDKDVVQNVSSKNDSTWTDSPTDHAGVNTALLRSGARAQICIVSNIVTATTAAAQGFVVGLGGALTPTADPKVQPYAGGTDSSPAALFWTGRDSTVSPFNLATYVGKLALNVSLKCTGANTSGIVFLVAAFDAAGEQLSTQEVKLEGADLADNDTFDSHIDVTLKSSTFPISSMGVWIKTGAVERADTVSSGLVEAEEETSDIPVRGVHVVIFEGLNAKASLNFHAANVLTGVPDSTNAFISNSATDLVLDGNIVTNMLQAYRQNAVRAYTGAGKEASGQIIDATLATPEMDVKMNAFSFKDIGRAFRRAVGVAKATRRDASNIAATIQPGLREGGGYLSTGVFGPQGQAVGSGMLTADAAINRARNMGILTEGQRIDMR